MATKERKRRFIFLAPGKTGLTQRHGGTEDFSLADLCAFVPLYEIFLGLKN
jgi:hypothetical protein